MAPDADKLRLRKAQLADEKENEDAVTQRIVTMKSLKGTEVCIDGGIYDIADFDHPGGEQILLFGGNDVTVQYKMIHPHHTSKHLEKMKKVGTATDYMPEYVHACHNANSYVLVRVVESWTHKHSFLSSLTLTDTSLILPLREKSKRKSSRLCVVEKSLELPDTLLVPSSTLVSSLVFSISGS